MSKPTSDSALGEHRDERRMSEQRNEQGGRRARLVLDMRISIGAVLHALLLLAGGIWALSEIKTELSTEIATISAQIAAIQKDLDEFKSDMKKDVAELRGEINDKQDRLFPRIPARP